MDVVVTVPKSDWRNWLSEGDLPGEDWSGQYSYFWIGKRFPKRIRLGDRVYVVAFGRLRGYAPLFDITHDGVSSNPVYALVRRGGAVACTIDEAIRGFQGFRYRWWERSDEKPFPNWKSPYL